MKTKEIVKACRSMGIWFVSFWCAQSVWIAAYTMWMHGSSVVKWIDCLFCESSETFWYSHWHSLLRIIWLALDFDVGHLVKISLLDHGKWYWYLYDPLDQFYGFYPQTKCKPFIKGEFGSFFWLFVFEFIPLFWWLWISVSGREPTKPTTPSCEKMIQFQLQFCL